MSDSIEHKINAPESFRYNDDHLWMEHFEYGFIKCGITEYLCNKTGEIISVEFVRNILNMEVNSGDTVLSIESLNDSVIIKTPISGIITDINQNCLDIPDLINNDPFGEGWLFIVSTDDIHDFELQMPHDEYEYLIIKEIEDMDNI